MDGWPDEEKKILPRKRKDQYAVFYQINLNHYKYVNGFIQGKIIEVNPGNLKELFTKRSQKILFITTAYGDFSGIQKNIFIPYSSDAL